MQNIIQSLIKQSAGYTATGMQKMEGHDGYAWRATIKKGNTKVCDAYDDGWGGGVLITPHDPVAYAEFQEVANKEFSHYQFEREGALAGAIADATESIGRIKRKAKTNTLIQLKEDNEDEYRVIKTPYSASIGARLRAQYGDRMTFIVNEELAKLDD